MIDQALEAGEKALELDEENVDALALMEICNLLSEQYEDAKSYTSKARALSPSNSFVAAVHSFSVLSMDGPKEAIVRIRKPCD